MRYYNDHSIHYGENEIRMTRIAEFFLAIRVIRVHSGASSKIRGSRQFGTLKATFNPNQIPPYRVPLEPILTVIRGHHDLSKCLEP